MVFPLRQLPVHVRVGLSGVLVTIGVGLAASAMHLVWHSQSRDERPGMTLDDVQSAYHGLTADAPLARALLTGHPASLRQADRDALLAWLSSGKVSEHFDSLDLGAAAPGEIMARSCAQCHSRKAAEGAGGGVALEFWDDVKKVAFARKIEPMAVKVLAISTHTHALSLATLAVVVYALALCTRRARVLVHWLIALGGVGLALDICSWWLARNSTLFVPMIAAGGTLFAGSAALLTVLVFFELWLPTARARSATGLVVSHAEGS